MTLVVPEMCFWSEKSRKNLNFLNFLRCIQVLDVVLEGCSDITEANRLLHCFSKYCCIVNWNEFFFICKSGFRLMFPRLPLLLERLQLDITICLITKCLILGFVCWNMLRFVVVISGRTEICRNCSSGISFDYIKSFRYLVCGVFWFLLQICPYFSAKGLTNIDWCAWAMQCIFTCYVFACSCLAFPQVMIDFRHDCITCKSGNFYLRKDAGKTARHAVYSLRVNWSVPKKNR